MLGLAGRKTEKKMKMQKEEETKEGRMRMLFRSEGGGEEVGNGEDGEGEDKEGEEEREEDGEEEHREETEEEKEEEEVIPKNNKGTKRTNHQISTETNVSPVLFYLCTRATMGKN